MRICFVSAVFFLVSALFAYNPPAGGNNYMRITSPNLMAGGKSVAGGAVYSMECDSVLNNPALPSYNQRYSVQLGATALLNENKLDREKDNTAGGGFELGVSIPAAVCVATCLFQGVFVPFDNVMDLENNLGFTVALSRDLTKRLALGAAGLFAWNWGNDAHDFAFLGSAGLFFKAGDISFMKDTRLGLCVSNIGGEFSETNLVGADGHDADIWQKGPTLKIGGATRFIDERDFVLAVSLDLSLPEFHNFVFDTSMDMVFKKVVSVKLSWEYDVHECVEGRGNIVPALGVGFHFALRSKNRARTTETYDKKGDMVVSAAWQNMYNDVEAYSLGVSVDFGEEDNTPPVIILWGIE